MNTKILSCIILCVFFQNNLRASDDQMSSYVETEEQVSIEARGFAQPTLSHKATFRDIVGQIIQLNKAKLQFPFLTRNDSSESQSHVSVSDSANDELAEKLTELITRNGGDSAIITIETSLCDLLKKYPQLNSIIQSCSGIKELTRGQDVFDIKKYAKPRYIMNLVNIGSGVLLDAGRVVATYFCPGWLSAGIIALSAVDGGILGINSWLDTKIQEVIDYYGHSSQDENEIIIGAASKEMLSQSIDTMHGLYSALLRHIDEKDSMSEIKEQNEFKILQDSMARLKGLGSCGNKMKIFTKGLSMLGAASVGIVSFLCGKENKTTQITATVSMGLSAVSERFLTINSNAHIAVQLLNLCNTYIEFWDLIDYMYTRKSMCEA